MASAEVARKRPRKPQSRPYVPPNQDQLAILAAHEEYLRTNEDALRVARDSGIVLRSPINFRKTWKNVDLSGRDLRHASMPGIDLGGARLERARLDHADLSGAKLHDADLHEASFGGTDLRRADLRDAHAATARLLSVDNLGGADLRGFEPPATFGGFDGLKSVEEVSKYIQGLYKILLGLCGFGVLTMLSFRDEQLLDHGGASMTQVPALQAAITPSLFVVVVPIFVLFFYIYFLVYVFALWRELSYLPAYFPDGAALDRKAYPMLLSSYVRVHFDQLKDDKHTSKFQMIVATFMAFGLPTLSCFLFWAACVRKHDLFVSGSQSLVFALILGLSVSFYYMAGPILRQEEWEDWSPILFRWWNPRGDESDAAGRERTRERLARRRAARHDAMVRFLGEFSAFTILALFEMATRSAIWWPSPLDGLTATARFLLWLVPIYWCVAWGVRIWKSDSLPRSGASDHLGEEIDRRPAILAAWSCFLPVWISLFIGSEQLNSSGNEMIQGVRDYRRAGLVHPLRLIRIVNPFMDVTDKVLSARPVNWSGRAEAEDDEMKSVVGEDLEGADLRSLDANRVFLIRANLRSARLDFANLRNANLRGADLRNATMTGAILRNASLRDAWLRGTILSGALIAGADPMEPIEEGGVNLQGARIAGIRCEPSELWKARNYELAYFGIRDPTEHDQNRDFMSRVGLEIIADKTLALKDLGSHKFRTDNLRGADFRKFDLHDAVFKKKTSLRDAMFQNADLRGVKLIDCDLQWADFRGAKFDACVDMGLSRLDGADFSGTDLSSLSLTDDQIASIKTDERTKLPGRWGFGADGSDGRTPGSSRIGREAPQILTVAPSGSVLETPADFR